MGKLVLIACTNVGRAIVEEIKNNPDIHTELVGVVDLNTAQSLKKANYDSYVDLALQYDLPIHYCDHINDEVTLNWIKGKNPDLIIQSGWSQKFGDALLSIPKYGCIGEHPAPLPRGRGAACVNWAVLTGEKDWGDSFFQMVQQYDAGKLYAQKHFNIESYDTCKTVYDKVALASKLIVRENLDQWSEGQFKPMEQDLSKMTYYKKRHPEDGFLDFSKPAKELDALIRATTYPYPCAYYMDHNKKIKVISAYIGADSNTCKDTGTVISNNSDGSVSVQCGDSSVLNILYVQEEGEPARWAFNSNL